MDCCLGAGLAEARRAEALASGRHLARPAARFPVPGPAWPGSGRD